MSSTVTVTQTKIGSGSSPYLRKFTSKPKPSLIDPDFSGLWSVSRLGHKKKWWSKIAGSIVLSLFIYSWFLGFFVPAIIIALFIIGYTNVALLSLSIVILLYLIRFNPQPWIGRIYMTYGPHYFDGGSSVIIEKEPVDRDPTVPICASMHPHGIFCFGIFLSNRETAMHGIKNANIRKEFLGKMTQWKPFSYRWPEISLCNNMHIKSMMREGLSFRCYPAGFQEASRHRRGEHFIYIKNRKGLIKYCLEYGYEIYPVYVFGESQTYYNYNGCLSEKYKNLLNKYQLPAIWAMGPYWYCLPLLPYANTGIHIIYGANTYYEKVENPTQEKIDFVHKWYMDEINNLFERNKWRFGYDDSVKLKIM